MEMHSMQEEMSLVNVGDIKIVTFHDSWVVLYRTSVSFCHESHHVSMDGVLATVAKYASFEQNVQADRVSRS